MGERIDNMMPPNPSMQLTLPGMKTHDNMTTDRRPPDQLAVVYPPRRAAGDSAPSRRLQITTENEI
jgi:hypothetical protein